jgi:hypothetical protein
MAERNNLSEALRRLKTDFGALSQPARGTTPPQRSTPAVSFDLESPQSPIGSIRVAVPADSGATRHVVLNTGGPSFVAVQPHLVTASAGSPASTPSAFITGSGTQAAASDLETPRRAVRLAGTDPLAKRPPFSSAISPHTSRLAPRPESAGTLHISGALPETRSKPVLAVTFRSAEEAKGARRSSGSTGTKRAVSAGRGDAPLVVPVTLSDLVHGK